MWQHEVHYFMEEHMAVAGALALNYSYQSSDNYQTSDPSGKALIVEKTLGLDASFYSKQSDPSSNISKALTLSAQQIVAKLNELIKDKYPQGIENLKPQDVSSEATADRVVSGITALFDAFSKQNKDLSPEELVSKFAAEAKKGVDQGYGEAKDILEGLGAFEFEGVESSIEKTRELILQKLDRFA
jgi:hypothetical protein